jgi:hypothetical protein
MGASAWTSFLVPIAVGLSFALLRRFFPVRLADGAEPPLTDEERRVYRRWELGALLPIFLLVPLLGYAWYLALKGASGLFHQATPATRYLVQPIPIFWGLPALFLGIISSAIPTEWLYRCLLRDRYRRYERFCNERAGYDGRRALVWLAGLFTAGSAVCFLAGVRSFARFDEAGVEIGRPLAFRSTFYPYARVKAIEHRATFRAPNGNTIRRPHYVILFDDGTSWSTRGAFRDPVPEIDERIVQLVARRSGRSIEEQPRAVKAERLEGGIPPGAKAPTGEGMSNLGITWQTLYRHVAPDGTIRPDLRRLPRSRGA